MSGFQYPTTTEVLSNGSVLRISFSMPISSERLTLVLGDEVQDLSGNPLDGEIALPSLALLPSGDGVAGGLAVLRFDILKGDANGDGVTNALDAALVVTALGACAGDADFGTGADLNNDGCVNVLDVQIVLSGQGGSLPPLDGAPPTISSISRADGSPLSADLELLVITFSEELNPLSIVDGVVSMRDFDGTVFLPAATALGGDGRTIECNFAPAISACGNYTVAISNAIADLSGELFVPPANPPGFTGSTPPATPILKTYTAITSAAGVTISGTIPQKAGFASAVEVRIQGPDQIVTTPASSTFSVTMPLEANEINYLYVSAISPCGIASAPVVAEVTRDNTAPNLTIQFPADARQIFDEFVNVGGTVGDTLSGFEGLTVSVNGQRAVVDIALGQNGTWLAENVHLNRLGQPTTLNVVASDVLGNTVTKSITVTPAAPPRNAAYLEVLSGDDQVGLVGTVLPAPIAVKVWKADGTPYANKLVDFSVTQNDGRLSGRGYGSDTMFYQVLTDASGVASASWTLGGTAGCGNHRVEATAKEVAGIALFSATAAADTPDQINIGSGNNQRVEVGSPAPLLLSAWVSDATNPVANVPVTFTVTSGGGFVNGQSQVTVPSDATGHADVEFTTGVEPGVNRVEATFVGNKTNPAVFTTYGIQRDYSKPTSFRGLVLDNASRPIGNVKITLKFGTTLVGPKLSNDQGQFEFTDLTNNGAVHVIVEGFLANSLNGQPIPPGVKFPSLGYDTSIVPNAENTLGKPILLPPMLPENTVTWDGQSDIELTCAGIEGLVFRVKANSMTLENGSHPTANAPVKLSLNQVHHDDIPMPMPNGVAPAFAWTFQPASATFDPPVEIEYPNMSVLPPGAMAYFLTFNHDLGEFEIMAPGRVSEDGSTIVTEPGTGLRLSGWGCNCPPYSVTGECKQSIKVAVALFEGGSLETGAGDGWEKGGWTSKIRKLDQDNRIAAVTVGATGIYDFTGSGQLDAVAAWYSKLASDQPNPPSLLLAGYSLGADSVCRSQSLPAAWRMSIDPIGRQEIFEPTCRANPSYCTVLQQGCTPAGVSADVNFVQTLGGPDLFACEVFGPLCFLYGPEVVNLFCQCATGYSVSLDADKVLPPSATHCNVLGFEIIWTTLRDKVVSSLPPRSDGSVAGEAGLPPLDDRFTLAIGGQVQIVDSDGGFSIPNVAAPDLWGSGGPGSAPDFKSDDPVRLVGTATIDGVMYYAFAEPVQIAQGQSTLIEAVTVTDTPPLLPASLSVSGPPLIEKRTSAAVATTASLNDGSTVDATPATSWTTYRTSNPALATVDKDGVVTAHQQGTVFITALNNAATAVRKILVTNEAAPTTIVGFVQLEDGTPVENAVLVTPLGGKGVSGRDGAFSFEVEVGQRTSTLNVTAVANIRGVTYGGTKLASPIALDGVSDVGVITVSASAPCDPSWLPTFGGQPGATSFSSLAVFDDGRGGGPALFAGGAFALHGVGGVSANGIARWDGVSWSPLGDGLSGTQGGDPSAPSARALVCFDDGSGAGLALYAGGNFISAGGQAAKFVAKWDGVSWSPVGTGMVGTGTYPGVNSLAVFDDGSGGGPALYAGGSFTAAGGTAANRIAKWNGSSWSPLGTGAANGVSGGSSPSVSALSVFDDGSGSGPALYAGGSFTTAGGTAANRIARWNGSSWSPLGSGMDDGVSCLTTFDDGSGSGPSLYAGGYFTAAGGTAANRIAKWNGTTWSALGTGLTGGLNTPNAKSLTVYDDGSGAGTALFVGGLFTTAGGVASSGIARWDGESWSALDAGVGGSINNSSVSALITFDAGDGKGLMLIAAGYFSSAGGITASSIAAWQSSTWSPLGTGMDLPANTQTVFDDLSSGGSALYAGGSFTTAGGTAVNRIAKWNGSSWSPLGTGSANGVNSVVYALTVFDDGSGGGPALYAGGSFTTAGGTAANRIAKWDGTSWSSLGTGLANGVNSTVRALTVFDDGSGGGPALYAGGSFTAAGGTAAYRIAKWNGSSWSPLGMGAANGVSGKSPSSVLALTVFDDGSGGGPALYAGGFFTTAGGTAANRIAKWNGTSWSSLGTGLANGVSSTVRALTVFDDGSGGGPALYAGGSFTAAGGTAANRIAKWDGGLWYPLGSGVSGGTVNGPAVDALVGFTDISSGESVLVTGGDFTSAGGVQANSIAMWNGKSWAPVGAGVSGSTNGGSTAVLDLLAFDDGAGDGVALYAGGNFTVSPAGDSFLAKWGCVTSDNDAPSRPQPAVVAHGDRRTATTASTPTTDRTLRRGESLILGDGSVRFGTLTALAGSTLRLAHANAHLTVSNLIIEPGATFEWVAGTIEIDAGAWLHPNELTIGCEREAKLLLTADAFVRAPQVTICGLGSLVGQGSVDAPTTNAGTVAGDASGLRVLGPYGHEPSGTIAASVAELAAIAADQLHPCTAVDELNAPNEIEPIQRIDVDRDGDLDLVRRVRLGVGALSFLWLDRGDGAFGSPILCGSDLASQRVSLEHLNDDGLLDLLITSDEGLRCHALGGGAMEVLR